MVKRPEVLICDEPTSALDVSVQAQIPNLLSDLQEEFGLTTLIITHDMEVVHQLANRVAVPLQGRLVEQGPAEQLLTRPEADYTRTRLAAADLRPAACPAMEGAVTVNEGNAAANHLIAQMLDRACPLAWKLARGFGTSCGIVVPLPDRMAENLARSKAQCASERQMMRLAAFLGHQQVHDLLYGMLATPGIGREEISLAVAALPELAARRALIEFARASRNRSASAICTPCGCVKTGPAWGPVRGS